MLLGSYKKIRGYTLIEIMVVVVIIGILASIIIPKIVSRPEQARIVKAKEDVRVIESALELYRLDNGFYPTTDQGLQALVVRPSSDPIPQNWKADGYLKELPVDPWGHPYQYLNPGVHGEIDVFSMGPPSASTGANAESSEIGNWSTAQNTT